MIAREMSAVTSHLAMTAREMLAVTSHLAMTAREMSAATTHLAMTGREMLAVTSHLAMTAREMSAATTHLAMTAKENTPSPYPVCPILPLHACADIKTLQSLMNVISVYSSVQQVTVAYRMAAVRQQEVTCVRERTR